MVKDLFSLWEQNVLFHFYPYKGELATMSDSKTIGHNSGLVSKDDLNVAIDKALLSTKEAYVSIGNVGRKAVRWALRPEHGGHGDTTFCERIFVGMSGPVKKNKFKDWVEDMAGCEWDVKSKTFKLLKGKKQMGAIPEYMEDHPWTAYERPVDPEKEALKYSGWLAKSLTSIVKGMSHPVKSNFVVSGDPVTMEAAARLVEALTGKELILPEVLDELIVHPEPYESTDKAVGF